jgi:hypothetical protein
MWFFRRHWYEVGAVVAVGAVGGLAFMWQDMGVLQLLLLTNFIVQLVQRYQEYGLPGGGEVAQLVVDERERIGCGLGVAGRGGVKQDGHVGHACGPRAGHRTGRWTEPGVFV